MCATNWYSRQELLELGIAAVGEDVRVSVNTVFLNPGAVHLGSHLRIDPFCVISAGDQGLSIGSYIHLATGVCLFGGGGKLVLEDFSQISCRSVVYTANDDYRDGWLTGPTVPSEFRKVSTGDVRFESHALVGAGSIILPGVTLGWGCSIGALTLIRHSVAAGDIVAGNPSRVVGTRNRTRLAELELKLREAVAC